MGWWSERVVPIITEHACNTGEMRPYRTRQCADLEGDVIEIGFGSGHNLGYLPATVHGLWAVEPSPRSWDYASKRVESSPIPVKRAGLDGQSLQLPDHSFDCALSTFTLCTIPDVDAALRELRRVLKPGGRFHFVEHGRSPDPKLAHRQDQWDPVQQRLFAGCHVNRAITALVERAGFRIEHVEHSMLKGPKVLGYVFEGVAVAVP
jgi:ubiquinone/menaquinone biosynthesis C-methylase UbiE